MKRLRTTSWLSLALVCLWGCQGGDKTQINGSSYSGGDQATEHLKLAASELVAWAKADQDTVSSSCVYKGCPDGADRAICARVEALGKSEAAKKTVIQFMNALRPQMAKLVVGVPYKITDRALYRTSGTGTIAVDARVDWSGQPVFVEFRHDALGDPEVATELYFHEMGHLAMFNGAQLKNDDEKVGDSGMTVWELFTNGAACATYERFHGPDSGI